MNVKKLVIMGVSLWMAIVGPAQDFRRADARRIALFPQQNEYRNRMTLSGIWNFQTDPEEIGERQKWFDGLPASTSIAVPGSWNDQTADMHDYLDIAWYETETFLPQSWKSERIFLRIGSAVYMAKVWINGKPLGMHEGGHLPFAFEISSFVKWGERNRITVQVENRQRPDRVPTGDIKDASLKNFPASNYDFFPYAGLNRDVWLYTLPRTASINDIVFKTDFHDSVGLLDVTIKKEGNANEGVVSVEGQGISSLKVPFSFRHDKAVVSVRIPDVQLWSPESPALYRVTVEIGTGSDTVDAYTLETGIRTVSVTEDKLLLNGKPVYLRGFGKHEDFPVFGRGTALPVMIKDFSLMKWVGANSFRTSHYPYDEEFYRMADREGFLIIAETPAVGLLYYDSPENIACRQKICEQQLNEMMIRDKNHPSVIMWSVANEPAIKRRGAFSGVSTEAAAQENSAAMKGLGRLIIQAKEQDATRPVSFAGVMGGPAEWLGLCDIICLNRYFGWYTHVGDFKTGMDYLSKELDTLHARYKKPVILTEFGADAIAGMHTVGNDIFSEEFQTGFLTAYLDTANTKKYIAGMHIWNFADFRTAQAIIRVGGMNLKGVFTRDREPKMAAHMLRARWNNPAKPESTNF